MNSLYFDHWYTSTDLHTCEQPLSFVELLCFFFTSYDSDDIGANNANIQRIESFWSHTLNSERERERERVAISAMFELYILSLMNPVKSGIGI